MARAFNGVQLLVLGGAGIGAFYAAAHLSQQEPKDAGAIVAPAVRPIAAAPHARGVGETPRASDASLLLSHAMAGAPAASASTPSAEVQGDRSAEVHGDRSAAIPGTTGQPFATLSWVAPPPPPPKPVVVAPAPPAPPVAPPLPFAFVGMVEKGTPRPQAFLSKGDALLVVSLGDTIDDGAYRVDAMNASQIVFTHLPTNTKQIITLSGGSQ
jgi:hypothetical protein